MIKSISGYTTQQLHRFFMLFKKNSLVVFLKGHSKPMFVVKQNPLVWK